MPTYLALAVTLTDSALGGTSRHAVDGDPTTRLGWRHALARCITLRHVEETDLNFARGDPSRFESEPL
jgi:hypothetical protein